MTDQCKHERQSMTMKGQRCAECGTITPYPSKSVERRMEAHQEHTPEIGNLIKACNDLMEAQRAVYAESPEMRDREDPLTFGEWLSVPLSNINLALAKLKESQ